MFGIWKILITVYSVSSGAASEIEVISLDNSFASKEICEAAAEYLTFKQSGMYTDIYQVAKCYSVTGE